MKNKPALTKLETEMLDALKNAAAVIEGLMSVLEKHGIDDPCYPIGLKPNLARQVIAKAEKGE